jgi:hypothetical protein
MTHDCIYFAVTHADGSVGVMTYVVTEYEKNGTVRRVNRSDSGAIKAVMTQYEAALSPDLRPVKGWREMTQAEWNGHQIVDRDYRDALRDDGKTLAIDMPAARAKHLQLLRHERGAKLDALDREWMRETGRGRTAEADAIEAKREALRNAPADLAPAIEAAAGIEELKAVKLPE